MKALHFNGKTLTERSLPAPRRRRGEALIRVRLAGICSTDIEILRGYMAFTGVPGHEFVGTVVATSTEKFVGKRVVGEINAACGGCAMCRRGLPHHCSQRTVLGIAGRSGAFAELLTLPERNLHVVPDTVSDEEAVFTELLAAACEIPAQVPIRRADRTLILGDGRLAAMAAQVLRRMSGFVVVLGRDRKKLDVIGRLGIEASLLPAGRTEHAFIRRLAASFDVVIDCTGNPAGLPLAAQLVRPRGTIVLKSTYEGPLAWNPAPIVVDEITIIGSRCGPFEDALSLLARRKVKVLPFLTAVYPFSAWKEAFRRSRSEGAFKVALSFTGREGRSPV